MQPLLGLTYLKLSGKAEQVRTDVNSNILREIERGTGNRSGLLSPHTFHNFFHEKFVKSLYNYTIFNTIFAELLKTDI